MEEEWNRFKQTGSVSDYLAYRKSADAGREQEEPGERAKGRSETSQEMKSWIR